MGWFWGLVLGLGSWVLGLGRLYLDLCTLNFVFCALVVESPLFDKQLLKAQRSKAQDQRPKCLFNNFKIDPLRCHSVFLVSEWIGNDYLQHVFARH